MTPPGLDTSPGRSHNWRRPLFWKLLTVDGLLVGATALVFPGQAGSRLVVMILALLAGGLAINVALTPAAPPSLHRGVGAEDEAPVRDRERELVRRSLRASEDHRSSIARRLRENISQDLAALSLQLTAAIRSNRDSGVAGMLDVAQDAAAQLAVDVQAVADELYPGLVAELGLISALRSLRRRVMDRSGLEVELQTAGTPFAVALPVTGALLRVADEALDNVVRHALARSASVRVTFDSTAITVEIVDDGIGFDVASAEQTGAGVGLFRARELLAYAGGVMQIESAPGAGTRIVARSNVSVESQA